jgi:hypothetical protein
VPGAQGWVTQSQASHAWDEGGQQLLGVQLGQNILVAGVLLLVKVEQPHAQACMVGIQGTQQATRWRMTAQFLDQMCQLKDLHPLSCYQ